MKNQVAIAVLLASVASTAFAGVAPPDVIQAAFQQAEKVAFRGADAIRERESRHFKPIYDALNAKPEPVPSAGIYRTTQKHVGGLWCWHSVPSPRQPGVHESYSCKLERESNTGDEDIFAALKDRPGVQSQIRQDGQTLSVSGLSCSYSQIRFGKPGGLGASVWKHQCRLVVPR